MQKFRLGSIELLADVENAGTVVSEHSGKALPRIQINFPVHAQDVDAIKRALTAHKFESVDAGGGTKWSVETSSESYTGDPWRADHKFSLGLRLHEELPVTELVVDAETFRPYSYEETAGADGLEVAARVKLSGREVERLRKLQAESKLMNVVRRGISETPRRMRFGRLMWSGGDAEYKFNITLFDEGYSLHSLLDDPLITYPGFTSLRTRSKLQKLVEVLKSKGLLDQGELDAIDSATPTEEEWLTCDRVDDLDAFLDR